MSSAHLIESLQQSIDQIEAQGAQPEPDPQAHDPEYKQTKKRALNILSVRDYSVDELRKKLLAREHPEDAVERVLTKLQRAGLLNDQEYAQNYVRVHREKRNLSTSALRRELVKRGVADNHIRFALDQVEDEHEVAFGVALKKARSTVGLPREKRMRRILAMLARRGFPQSISMDVTLRALDET